MKILLWGNTEPFVIYFVQRLEKEKHEVYVIHGLDRKTEGKMQGAFEEYFIDYTRQQILTVIQNVNPDICMFLLDLHLYLNNQKKFVSYIAGLTNAVLSSKNAGIKRFYYLSSAHVFDLNQDYSISEKLIPAEKSEMTKQILQCEQICLLNQNESFQTTIIRCGELYSTTDFSCVNNIFIHILREASLKGKADINQDFYHPYIHVQDACEAFYRVIFSELEFSNPILAVSAVSVSEEHIVQMMKRCRELKVNNQEGIKFKQHEYRCGTLQKLGYKERYILAMEIPAICNGADKWDDAEKKNKKKNKPFLPLLETFAIFILVQLFIGYTFSNDFHRTVDVYLIFVLIIAIYHGTAHAIFAVVLSAAGRMLLLQNPMYQSFFLDYRHHYFWILELFCVGALTGYMKDNYKRRRIDLEEEKEYLESELRYSNAINRNGQEVKAIYEKRLLNYKDSFAKISNIVLELDHLEPQKVIFEAVHVVERVMNSSHVCFYTVDKKSKFARLLASSKGKDSMLGKSFNLMDYEEIYSILKENEVYVNRLMEPGLPLFIKALFQEEEVSSLIMVYNLDFDSYGLQEVNMFSILCELIDKSVSRAYTYMEGIKFENYIAGSNIMKWDAFKKVLELYCYGEANSLLEYTLLKLEDAMQYEEKIQKMIRTTDYLGICKKDYYILLTNTSLEDSDIVAGRFKTIGASTQILTKEKGNTIEEVFPSFTMGESNDE